MQEIFKQVPLYRFLAYCLDTNSPRRILDCGAGGDMPPLSLFSAYGFTTYGVDADPVQCELANDYGRRKGQTLNIRQGDMRQLDFPDQSMGFAYSYNSIFHMRKKEVQQSVEELKRVLMPGGLMFVNFLTTNDFRCGQGPDVGNHEHEQFDDDLPVIHSYYEPGEPDALLSDMEILYKEDRVLERIFEGERIRQGFVDYIVRKKAIS
ncbi:class I SAM-dependent methyltransferase [Paenibacillus timonensis]|jgi:SAM-dependent methyltransferase|uniref:Class I SAM-dependent methyltransferase n=1 Tax=Paenibacillus timonensis TaxID=225915 RepID=A0ABW3S940_9BACL|nr:class I SAM-dependent methyltransferase [Paenibacillus timonensis]MCH1639267.1 class I SAM-dependent methyltransferase [Paenibacillus timonensis]